VQFLAQIKGTRIAIAVKSWKKGKQVKVKVKSRPQVLAALLQKRTLKHVLERIDANSTDPSYKMRQFAFSQTLVGAATSLWNEEPKTATTKLIDPKDSQLFQQPYVDGRLEESEKAQEHSDDNTSHISESTHIPKHLSSQPDPTSSKVGYHQARGEEGLFLRTLTSLRNSRASKVLQSFQESIFRPSNRQKPWLYSKTGSSRQGSSRNHLSLPLFDRNDAVYLYKTNCKRIDGPVPRPNLMRKSLPKPPQSRSAIELRNQLMQRMVTDLQSQRRSTRVAVVTVAYVAQRVAAVESLTGYTFDNKMLCVAALKTSDAGPSLKFGELLVPVPVYNRLALIGDRLLEMQISSQWYETETVVSTSTPCIPLPRWRLTTQKLRMSG
jgi:hypothetical protein